MHDTRVKRLRLSASGARLEERLSDGHRDRFEAVFRKLGPAAEAAWRRVMAEIGARKRSLALIARVRANASPAPGSVTGRVPARKRMRVGPQ